jgi:hypothetical protein
MLNRNLPTVVYHADWGTDPKKRWHCKAVRQGVSYKVQAPALVGDHFQLLNRVKGEVGTTGAAVVGFDFPIGVPAQYATLLGVREFKPLLLELGLGNFAKFYDVCRDASQITKFRPFYPYNYAGIKKQQHLLAALDATHMDQLRRKCDLPHDGRRAACALFWTLGSNQVGKGTIIGWRDVIAPALRGHRPPVLWPFDGCLDDLLKPGNIVIVETYPAECYGWFFEHGVKSKGELDVREKLAPALLHWAQSANVTLDPMLKGTVEAGFPEGDDAFDATVGLFGMLEVLLKRRDSGEPNDESVRKLEGWILGQKSASSKR